MLGDLVVINYKRWVLRLVGNTATFSLIHSDSNLQNNKSGDKISGLGLIQKQST